MKIRLRGRTVALLCGTLLLLQWSLSAQAPAPGTTKRPLTYDAVDYWQTIGGTRLSDDGQWVLYSVTSQAEDGELIVRNLRTSQEFKHPRGTGGQFTPEGKFAVFTIAQSKADEERERQQNRARGGQGGEGGENQPAAGRGQANQRQEPRTGLGIMSLADGKVTTVDKVGSFKLAEESATWLAYYKGTGGGGGGPAAGGRGGRGAPPPAAGRGQGAGPGGAAGARNRKQPGSDMVLRNLTTGEEVTTPDVTEYVWNQKGTLLAYTVSSNDETKDGAFVRRMSDASVVTLHAGKGRYRSITFDEAGQQVAFLSDQAEFDKPVAPFRVYYWKAGDAKASARAEQATELVSAATAGMPKGMAVADDAPRFSRDGGRLFFATAQPPPPPPDPNDNRPEPLAVDLWSTRDPWLQPMQRVRAEQERNRSYRAVYHLADRRLVQLATPELPTVTPGDDLARAIGTSDLPYRMAMSWDQTYNDVYLLDLKTGKPNRVLEQWGSASSMSPGGRYLLYFDSNIGHWHTYRTSDGARVNLTAKVDVKFQQDNDTPNLPGPYGVAGWTADDRAVLLYDQYDIWEFNPNGGTPRNITGGEGRQQQTVLRYRGMDPQERTVPSNRPLFLAATDERTRATGFYRLASLTTSARPEKIVMLDKAFGAVSKAKNADTVVFTLTRYEEFPDLWTSDLAFKDMTKISSVGKQQDAFVWGRSEIIDYINADGQVLRAILTKPENFDPSKKYPLMVYIYEELTQGLHSYSNPGVGHSVNIPRYVSNGYVVLRPDIVYTTGYPGEAAEKCVIPAVNTVVAQGYIDPKRIGIQGHSWGGYQITHLITRTNLFAAVEAGASVSNMISAYGGIRWGTGMSRAFQYERTQSRIGAPPWDAPLQFIENSPIFWVKKINTPYLTIHNDQDDAVPWYQGIEFITALRRLGKEGYMFNYNGELHGLRNRDNMKHFTVHMDEFFDHYLLGRPRPEWMDKGVPFLERGRRDVSPMFKKKVVTTTNDQSSR